MGAIKIKYETSDGLQFTSANLAEMHETMLAERPDKSYRLLVRATGYCYINAYKEEDAEGGFAEDLEAQDGINYIDSLIDEWEEYEILKVEEVPD